MAELVDIERELKLVAQLIQAQAGQREAQSLLLDAMLIAMAQVDPELIVKTDQTFRKMLEKRRERLAKLGSGADIIQTFESKVEEMLRMLALLK